PRRRIEQARMRCDELQQRLTGAMQALLSRARHSASHTSSRLATRGRGRPLALPATRLAHLDRTLAGLSGRVMHRYREQQQLLQTRLDAISPLRVLTRGYALVQDASGTIARDASRFPPGAELRVTLAKGTLTVQVLNIQESG
ncbi:MAG: hypothetical protein HQL95_04810, partial [Magnetococcales bacterium]|nr:hypothetical protein [Magnetococcales bacterium]